MRTGRPNKGSRHVDSLPGGATEKARLHAIVQALTGERTVDEACAGLGIRRAYFQELRQKALLGALEALVPRQPGRRPQAATVTAAELEALRRDKAELEEELVAMMARVELAMAMPRLLRPQATKGGGRRSGSTGSGRD